MSELIKELVLEKEALAEEAKQVQWERNNGVSSQNSSMGQGNNFGNSRQPLKQVTNVFEEKNMRNNLGYQNSFAQENYEENPMRFGQMPHKKLNFDPRIGMNSKNHFPGISTHSSKLIPECFGLTEEIMISKNRIGSILSSNDSFGGYDN